MMTLVAALPIIVMLVLLGVLRKPAWMASLLGLATAVVVALWGYSMPLPRLVGTVTNGAAFGLWPIGWIVFAAILLYRVVLETGRFEVLKDSIGHLTDDSRLQALLIAFSFGAFIEAAAGFGTPVAVAAPMLVGLGFSPFNAAGIALLANTVPVAFGSVGLPIITLAGITGLPVLKLSAGAGRLCAPIALFVPAYLVVVMSGWKGLRKVLPSCIVCGVAFAATQFAIANFIGPQLACILASLVSMGALVIMIRVTGAHSAQSSPHSSRETFAAWLPYFLLVILVLLWGYKPLAGWLDKQSLVFHWPALADKAPFKFNWLSASGTACLFAAILGALFTGVSFGQFVKVLRHTGKQLALAELTLAAVLAMAYTMNYSGATTTLGLAFAATGAIFPFCSAMLGWLGVFLSGSDTSSNALFGHLQIITATKLHMNPTLMAAANTSGGVMGKMISLTSIAVAVAATNMKRQDEALLFRFTFRHSIVLASVLGLLVMFYAYVMPVWAP